MMEVNTMYLNVKETAEKWKISERSVRNYCSHGKIPGAIIDVNHGKYPKMQLNQSERKETQ